MKYLKTFEHFKEPDSKSLERAGILKDKPVKETEITNDLEETESENKDPEGTENQGSMDDSESKA
ncbi:MAG: hypothetical protein JNL60_02415 [Bacteroidia bacterium]|nr:hypothetical protein [Bacteroidia bacterium]